MRLVGIDPGKGARLAQGDDDRGDAHEDGHHRQDRPHRACRRFAQAEDNGLR